MNYAAAQSALPAVITRPLSWLFEFGVASRVALYGIGLLPRRRLQVPVISVGNLSVGGTGKTPFTAYLVERLRDRGLKPAILSRGYGSSRSETVCVVSDGKTLKADVQTAGDEPFMLARSLKNVPILTSHSRHAAGEQALRDFDVNVLVLDDGFQHMSLERDIDLVLVDSRFPPDRDRPLPAGRLRERMKGLERAAGVILTRCGDEGSDSEFAQRLRMRFPALPTFTTNRVPGGLLPLETRGKTGGDPGNEALAPGAGSPIAAISGIAFPNLFETDLEESGFRLMHCQRFPDHHWFQKAEIDQFLEAAVQRGAIAAVTTEKDAARISWATSSTLPLYYFKIRTVVEEEEALLALIQEHLQ